VAQAQLPLLPASLLMRNRFASLDKIGRCRRPIFLAEADRDRLVPYAQGERLRSACAGWVQFHRLAGLDHNDPLPSEFYTALHAFLQEPAPLRRADEREVDCHQSP
jgi:fermentation-respiration switch protein FrsA (DUF1100 family)